MNDYNGQSMVIREPEYYEHLFKELEIEVVSVQNYKAYAANGRSDMHAERVWLLRESPNSDLMRACNQARLFTVEKNANSKYALKLCKYPKKTLEIKDSSKTILKTPVKIKPTFITMSKKV